MPCMVVTLDVSRLSGWLKADAPCRVERRLKAVGGGRARAERTENMDPMYVTLDVSKLSGWLNALADCRESKGGHMVRGEGVGQ